MKRLLLCVVLACSMVGNAFAKQTQEQMYQFAKDNDIESLIKNTDSLNVTNYRGDTALCAAIRDDNIVAYNVLRTAGANRTPKCINSIDREKYTNFISRTNEITETSANRGMGKWGWGLLGAGLLVAGGGAAAVTLSGNGDNKSSNNKCVHGDWKNGKCVCSFGFTGTFCERYSDEIKFPTYSGDYTTYGNNNIKIENNTEIKATVYGVYSDDVAAKVDNNKLSEWTSFETDIFVNTSGNVYGVYGDAAYNVFDWGAGGAGQAHINIDNIGTGDVYGIYGKTAAADIAANVDSNASIMYIYATYGDAYGIYAGKYARTISQITVSSENANAYGIYSGGGADNYGYIGVYSLKKSAVGIYADGGNVTNTGTIDIQNSGTAIGIYAASGATVNNSGTITINGAKTAYGIYAEKGATVKNTGTISIDGVSCDGATCAGNSTYGNHIVLNGATLFQDGKMVANTLNLDDMGGNVVAGTNARFVVENEISGTLTASSDIVAGGFDTTYVAENMIQAGDTSKLTLRSGSAMFDARLANNGNDVVMTMKSFDSLTDNKSLANFLSSNYANGNGAAFFGGLKSGANMAEFNNILNGLSGMNAFTQFDREDMSAMREINFNMNQQMFMNGDRDEYNVSGSMEHFSFSNSSNGGSGSYGISNGRMSDKWKLGYGLAMANIGTSDDFGTNRSNQIGLFYMPMTYTNNSIEFISTPRVGFAKSHYSRRGYNNMNYDGYIEKQIFGFNNDLRYPITFGNWTIAPDLGFNAIMYRQSGHESDQAFSLIIPADEIYSAEAGLGLFTKYERKLDNGSLRFNSGVMLYRELADTYNMKLGIRGLDGTFNLYDDAEHNYSGAATFGFDYNAGRLSLYGNAQYFVDTDHYMNFKGGIRFRF